MGEGKSSFEKKSQIKLAITFELFSSRRSVILTSIHGKSHGKSHMSTYHGGRNRPKKK